MIYLQPVDLLTQAEWQLINSVLLCDDVIARLAPLWCDLSPSDPCDRMENARYCWCRFSQQHLC